MNSRKKYLAAAVVATATMACAPAAALGAVTASVTGDGGAPVALTAGATLPIHNVDVKAFVHVDSTDAGSYRWTVVDANGTGATTPSSCWTSRIIPDDSSYVTYHGNLDYGLTLNLYSDEHCVTPKATPVYKWSVAATVALGQNGVTFLTRQPNSFSTLTQNFDFAPALGATLYEIKYALGGVLTADGSISGPVKDAYLNRTTGKVEVSESTPGSYVMVARAKSGDFFTPWSAPVNFRLIAPFDLSSTSFPDARGPRYQVRGIVGETSAGGKVTVAVAEGKTGGRYRTLGKGKVNSKGVFQVRFTLRKYGVYRMRFSFRGSSTVARGTVTKLVRIRRVLV